MRRQPMKRTWKPTVAGILNVIAGVFGLLGGLVLVVLGSVGSEFLAYLGCGMPQLAPFAFLLATGVPLLILGILALIGGIYALRRKIWGLALAGSIATVLFSQLLGILAIIFIALSEEEFD